MATAQDILDLARLPLNDAGKVRYLDADGLRYLNAGLAHLKRMRPDLFIGSLATDQAALVIGGTVPTPAHVDQALADYVAARWQTVDAETSERSAAFFALSQGQL